MEYDVENKNENTNKEVEDLENEGVIKVGKKRIYNPKTGKYYKIRQRTTSKGKKGEIIGLWRQSPQKRTLKAPKQLKSSDRKIARKAVKEISKKHKSSGR